MRSDEEILSELRIVTAGLLVMSESDYPFEVIQWDGQTSITPEFLCRVSDRPEGSTIEETDLDTFFSSSESLRNVLDVLRKNLADLKVYKVGAISIPVYIIGLSAAGNWLGLSTRLVQT